MPLDPGTKLAHYEIVSSLGAGGMGEVYRAEDTKLCREVAVKLLLEEVSDNAERLARFEREARVLASLNHTNIATLYGFEKEGDTRFLVMELIEGDTLADRLARGPIPLEEAPHLFLEIPAVQEIAISSDGATMAIGRRPLETMASEVRVVLNWFAELESLVPP